MNGGISVFLRACGVYALQHLAPLSGHAPRNGLHFMRDLLFDQPYEMMVGDKKWNMPLLRPFGLLMLTMWWGMSAGLVALPPTLFAKTEALVFHPKFGSTP